MCAGGVLCRCLVALAVSAPIMVDQKLPDRACRCGGVLYVGAAVNPETNREEPCVCHVAPECAWFIAADADEIAIAYSEAS